MTSSTKAKLTLWQRCYHFGKKHPIRSLGLGGATILLLYTVFLADHSLLQYFKNLFEISQLENQIAKCREEKEHDMQRLHALDSTSTAIYQFARERYYMKSKSEDVFIFQAADSLKKTIE